MLVSQSIYYCSNNKFYEKGFQTNSGLLVEEKFQVTSQVLEENNCESYTCKFTTLENENVHAYLLLSFCNNDDEKIVSIKSLLPEFNFKHFIPEQFEVITNKKTYLLFFDKPYSLDVAQEKECFKCKIVIDAPFMHPVWDYSKGERFSTAASPVASNTEYEISFKILIVENFEKLLTIKKSPYPSACQSAFILTDHCDFDTIEKLELFLYGNKNNGWLNRGLKITKGVFAIGNREDEQKRSDSLQDKEYQRLIDILFKDGSEIVHHALKHSGQISSQEFNEVFSSFSNKYNPQTWIDHGSYIKHCYSQGAKYNPDYLLIDAMKHCGYNNLWSFDDVNIDANQTLDILQKQKQFPFALIREFFKKLFSGKILVAAHYFRSIIHRNYKKNIVIDFLMFAMANTKNIFINIQKGKKSFIKDFLSFFKKIGKFSKYRNTNIVPYENHEVLKYALPLYLEEKRPFVNYKSGDILFFNTFETTHLIDIYSEKSINKLQSIYGTHIGHTYILNNLPYINSIFTLQNAKLALSNKWISFLDVLQKKVNNREVWNPNMGEYAAFNIALLNVYISYNSFNETVIENRSDKPFVGFTFIVNKREGNSLTINANTVVEAKKSCSNYWYFTFDLAPNSRYIISKN